MEDREVQKECVQGKKTIEIAQEKKFEKIYKGTVESRCSTDTGSQK